MSANNDHVIIFDTTLRDGEQSPGCTMTMDEKIEIAHALAGLGVDVIEAGFPIASPGDFEAVNLIAKEIEGPTICGLARCKDIDIDRAGEAIAPAKSGRIHVFLATSAIHRQFKLGMAKDEIIKRSVEGVQRAKQFTDNIEYSPEDAARTELDFLAEVVEAAIDAGATTVNIPDTVGYTVPQRFRECIEYLRTNVSNIDQAVISVHCHNDLGLAVANSLAAVEAGARQIECTINGIGERAGNASLEEVVMALRTRHDFYGVQSRLNTPKLYSTSRLVSNMTGMMVQRNKAIVGENAFAHEAGIHQDGMLKERTTYEIMLPEDVGFSKTNLVLGKHSGRHAFKDRVIEMGYHLSDEQIQDAFQRFIALADKKKEMFDADIEAIIENEIHQPEETWHLESQHTSAGSESIPTAAVRLKKIGDGTHEDAAVGDGPVDALFKTIQRITGVEAILTDYQVRAVTRGKDALGEASVELEQDGRKIRARATDTDIIEASAQAYVKAINKVVSHQTKADSAV